MKVFNFESVPLEDAGAGTAGVKIRWVIDAKTGAPNFAMRIFDFEPGGHTPKHTPAWEHEVFVLQGSGTAHTPEGDRPINTGDAVFVPGGEVHQFRNTSGGLLRIMCLIPMEKPEDTQVC